jgi:DNA-binding MarR family transcriptional regulator
MHTIQKRAAYLMAFMPRFRDHFQRRVTMPDSTPDHLFTMGQMNLLMDLEKGPASMGEMARQARVTLATMSGSVQRLVSQGLVERLADQTDRRIVRIKLTPLGRKHLKGFQTRMCKSFEALLRTLSDREQKMMITAFQTIESIMHTSQKPAALIGSRRK